MSMLIQRRKLLGGLLAGVGLPGCGSLNPKNSANAFIPLPALAPNAPLRVV
jgi:hypothetical protein